MTNELSPSSALAISEGCRNLSMACLLTFTLASGLSLYRAGSADFPEADFMDCGDGIKADAEQCAEQNTQIAVYRVGKKISLILDGAEIASIPAAGLVLSWAGMALMYGRARRPYIEQAENPNGNTFPSP